MTSYASCCTSSAFVFAKSAFVTTMIGNEVQSHIKSWEDNEILNNWKRFAKLLCTFAVLLNRSLITQ